MTDLLRETRLHAVLGAIVVTVGFWLAVGGVSPEGLAAFALGIAGLLAWQGTTLGRVWAWASLLIGLDSLAWPIVTMIQISRATEQPNDQQMSLILTAVVAGLISSVFWISFGSGIFRWIKWQETQKAEVDAKAEAADRKQPKKQSPGRL